MAPSNNQEHSDEGGVMKESGQFGKHGPVIAISEGRNISQEPKMKDLIEVDREMTEGEKERTEQYLKDQDGNNTLQGEKNKEV